MATNHTSQVGAVLCNLNAGRALDLKRNYSNLEHNLHNLYYLLIENQNSKIVYDNKPIKTGYDSYFY